MITKKRKIITNAFWHLANEHRKAVTDERDIEQNDLTDIFWKELDNIIEYGELINMNINAPPTSGKSLTGMSIAERITTKHYKREFGIKDIDRDQQEFTKTMRNGNIKNTVRVIDEWSELEATGENSSVESALYAYLSDVMAQRFVHKISCSPNESPDKNALIYLEVISADKINKISHCKLYYKISGGGITDLQFIGMVQIDVSNVLKKEWYLEYRRRKFEKMNLMLDEGIFRPRILDYAVVITEILEKLKPLTKLGSVLNAKIVRNYVKMGCREHKIVQSIVGERLATDEIEGVLDLWKSYFKLNQQLEKKSQAETAHFKKGNNDQAILINGQIKAIEKMRDEILNAINLQEKEYAKYIEIQRKYNMVKE